MAGRGEIPRAARAACRDALEAAGFRKRAGDTYTISIDGVDDAVGRVALNTAGNRPRGPFEINPIVGVHHHGIERARAEIKEQKVSAYDPATLLSPVGYLTPDNTYRAWYFDADSESDFGSVAGDLAQVVSRYGLPFIRGHATLEVITDDLEHVRYAVRDSRKTRLPLAYWLSGRPDEAEAALVASLDEITGQDNLAAQEYREFVMRLRERLVKEGRRGC